MIFTTINYRMALVLNELVCNRKCLWPAEKLNIIIINIITTFKQASTQPVTTKVIRHFSMRTIVPQFLLFFYFPISFFSHIYNSRDVFNTVHEWWLSSVSTVQLSTAHYTLYLFWWKLVIRAVILSETCVPSTPLNIPNHFHCKCNSKSITHTTDNEKRDKDNKICVCVCCTKIYECILRRTKNHTHKIFVQMMFVCVFAWDEND